MTELIPYKGFDDISFDMTIDEVRKLLRHKDIRFNTEQWSNKGCTPEVPWEIIRAGQDISLFFAKGRMFKIYFENGFSGHLNNGISLGMKVEEAKAIDPSLQYNEWDEDYISNYGYWLEDDIETQRIVSITIFIREVEDDELFFKYEWCSKK